MLLVEDSSVLLQARCHCTSGVGVCKRMWIGQYILSLPTVYAAVYDELLCEVTCIVHAKYCNHLLAVDMAGVACRGLWCACEWKNVKRYRDGSPQRYCGVIRSYLVWLLLDSHPLTFSQPACYIE